jgi:crooked neck
VFERFCLCHPSVSTYIKYAKFEMKNGDVGRARAVYERAVEELGEDGR